MSANNWLETRKRAFDIRKKTLTTSSTNTTYTAKVDKTAFEAGNVERVIDVITTAGNGMTVTVPDGAYSGQLLLITFLTEGSNETVTVTTTTGADFSLTAANDYCSIEWVNANVGWKAAHEVTT